MARTVILSYSAKEISLHRGNGTHIIGSWLYNLAKELLPLETDKHIKFIGRCEKRRFEIEVSVPLFELLKVDQLFIQKAITLRRIRSHRNSQSISLLESICFEKITDFDNDLDDPKVRELFKEKVSETESVIDDNQCPT